KIFNASKFVHLQLEGDNEFGATDISHPLDVSFILTLNRLVSKATESFQRFDFATALHRTEDLFWQFCDHYLELVKTRAYAEDASPERRSARATLMLSLQTFLKLLAPFQPYVTEEVWSWLFADQSGDKSIHRSSWPKPIDLDTTDERVSEETLAVAISVVSQIRGAKSAAQKSLKWPVETLRVSGPQSTLTQFELIKGDVLRAGIVDVDAVSTYDEEAPEKELLAVEVALAPINPNA
ncbi:MAG: class I tRNA ligase family protein, partial [Bradymonadia bacterium]